MLGFLESQYLNSGQTENAGVHRTEDKVKK